MATTSDKVPAVRLREHRSIDAEVTEGGHTASARNPLSRRVRLVPLKNENKR